MYSVKWAAIAAVGRTAGRSFDRPNATAGGRRFGKKNSLSKYESVKNNWLSVKSNW